jgi:hypothetical protein
MKSLLIALALVFGTVSTVTAEPTKKPAAQKKEIKKHKKVEGTKFPEKAPAKPKAPAKK